MRTVVTVGSVLEGQLFMVQSPDPKLRLSDGTGTRVLDSGCFFFVFDYHKFSRPSTITYVQNASDFSERDERSIYTKKKKKRTREHGAKKAWRNLRPKSGPNCLREKTGVFFHGRLDLSFAPQTSATVARFLQMRGWEEGDGRNVYMNYR
jgi:hypothetical protein